MRVRRPREGQVQLPGLRQIVGELTAARHQGRVFDPIDGLAAAKTAGFERRVHDLAPFMTWAACRTAATILT